MVVYTLSNFHNSYQSKIILPVQFLCTSKNVFFFFEIWNEIKHLMNMNMRKIGWTQELVEHKKHIKCNSDDTNYAHFFYVAGSGFKRWVLNLNVFLKSCMSWIWTEQDWICFQVIYNGKTFPQCKSLCTLYQFNHICCKRCGTILMSVQSISLTMLSKM